MEPLGPTRRDEAGEERDGEIISACSTPRTRRAVRICGSSARSTAARMKIAIATKVKTQGRALSKPPFGVVKKTRRFGKRRSLISLPTFMAFMSEQAL